MLTLIAFSLDFTRFSSSMHWSLYILPVLFDIALIERISNCNFRCKYKD